MVGDQVRGLGTKSEDGTHFATEKLVSGKFLQHRRDSDLSGRTGRLIDRKGFKFG